MGAGASVPDTIDESACRELAGESFDLDKFNSLKNPDGFITKLQWEHLIDAHKPNPAAEHIHVTDVHPEQHHPPSHNPQEFSLDQYIDHCLSLSAEDKVSFEQALQKAAVRREASHAKTLKTTGQESDYSKSFSGSAADTKREKEFGKMMAGEEDEHKDMDDPIFQPVVTSSDSDRYEALRGAGRWLRFLGAAGCFLYIHSTTHELVSIRPSDFEEEEETTVAAAADPSNGLYNCRMEDLMDELTKCIDEEKLTPLLVDASGEQELIKTFFSYKGMVADLAKLGLPIQEQRKHKIRARDEMEKLRKTAVNAIKAGATLAVNLGNIAGDINFPETLCKKDVFPVEMFQEAGKKILTPSFPAPRCAKMFRDEDKEQGQVTFRDDFQMVLISTLTPADAKSELSKSLPMDFLKVIYVMSGPQA